MVYTSHLPWGRYCFAPKLLGWCRVFTFRIHSSFSFLQHLYSPIWNRERERFSVAFNGRMKSCIGVNGWIETDPPTKGFGAKRSKPVVPPCSTSSGFPPLISLLPWGCGFLCSLPCLLPSAWPFPLHAWLSLRQNPRVHRQHMLSLVARMCVLQAYRQTDRRAERRVLIMFLFSSTLLKCTKNKHCLVYLIF